MMEIKLDGVNIKITNSEIEQKVKSIVLGSSIKREYKRKKYKWLTETERQQVIDDLSRGKTVGQVAKEMGRSYGVIRKYFKQIA